MKRASINEIKVLIEKAIETERKFISDSNGSENPQVIKQRDNSIARKDAFEATLNALNGNSVLLQIYGKTH